jgi:hypothetical protein
MAAASEYCRTEIKLPNDRRALGAVFGAIEHTAHHLSLSPADAQQLAAAAETLLTTVMAALAPEAELTFTIQEHPNRIELELIHAGAIAGEWAILRKLAGIDRFEEETDAGHTRLKLVKILPPGAGPASSEG